MSLDAIQKSLTDLARLLAEHAVEPWASRVADVEARLRDAHALNNRWAKKAAFADAQRLLYHGQHSFRNVVIRRELGDAIEAQQEEAVNARLDLLRAQLEAAILGVKAACARM